jgi:3',5'-cyclic AMP phosphodiesterase CpdA
MKFIHVSDLHFHQSRSDNKAATKTLKFIQNKYPSHHLIVTGDITDDGHESQYRRAAEALNPFKGRIFVCPGNHDFGAAGTFYSRERAERFDELLSLPLEQGGTFTGDKTPVVNIVQEDGEKVMVIALDTNLETEQAFDFACGKVGKTQRSALDNILTNPATRDMKKIVFFHHHPFMHNDPFMELKDARQVMRIMYNRVNVVLFGHKHVMGKWENCNGIRYVLASDDSPGKEWAREITVEKGEPKVIDVRIA